MHQKHPWGTCGWGRGATSAALAALMLSACNTEPVESLSQRAETASAELELCSVPASAHPSLQTVQQWGWIRSAVLPEFRHVMGVPAVVDVNRDGIPDVLFNTAQPLDIISLAPSDNFASKTAVLRALRGDSGSELWTVTDPTLRTRGDRGITTGDIDGDGRPEVCTISADEQSILCFRGGDGRLVRRITEPGRVGNRGELSLADLDGNGSVEILDGNRVYNSDGTLKWAAVSGTLGATPVAADLDLDGKQEVITGPNVYRHDGTLFCEIVEAEVSGVAVANFDADPQGEIVVTYGANVALYDHTCLEVWKGTVAGASFHTPNIADFDGDGKPEVGVGGAGFYAVFDTNGALLWKRELDNSPTALASTTFDFNGDGKLEVVLADAWSLLLCDAATGAVLVTVPGGGSHGNKAPIVVDADLDGSAEIVTGSGFPWGVGLNSGVRVYRGKDDDWPGTRRVWNQLAYSVTNVGEDGSIPAQPAVNWLAPALNTFRSNPQSPRLVPAPDLVVSEVRTECALDSETLSIIARVTNEGSGDTSGNVDVAFYTGDPASGGSLLGVATITHELEAEASTVVSLTFQPGPGGVVDVHVVADDNGHGKGVVNECNETNNSTSDTLDLTCSNNLPPVAVCQDVTVSADAQCKGSASVDNGSHDPDQAPQPLSVSESPAGPFGLGSHLVTLTASDGEASAQCTGTVTVVDTTPPAITCPASRVLECGATQPPFAAQATDNCGPAPATCTPPSGTSFPLGTTPVTCSAKDGSGNAASCGFTVTVRDTQAPVPGADKALVLWPPNHQFVTLSLEDCAASAQDACGGTLPLHQAGRILRVTSDEVEDDTGNGDGRTCQDVQLTGPTSFQVRAEREGPSDGRVYTVHYEVKDASGNTAPGTCHVRVPHSPGRTAVDSGPKFCVGSGCPSGTGGSALCQ